MSAHNANVNSDNLQDLHARGRAFHIIDGAALVGAAADSGGLNESSSSSGSSSVIDLAFSAQYCTVVWAPAVLGPALRRWMRSNKGAAYATHVVFVTEQVARRLAEQTNSNSLVKVFANDTWRLKCAYGRRYFANVVRPALGLCLLLAYRGTWLPHAVKPNNAVKLLRHADAKKRMALFAPAPRLATNADAMLELILLDSRAGDKVMHNLADRHVNACVGAAATHLGVAATAVPRRQFGVIAHDALSLARADFEMVTGIPDAELGISSAPAGPAFAVLGYTSTNCAYSEKALEEFANIGDDVQSLATIQALLPNVHMFVDRDGMFAHTFYGLRPRVLYRLRFAAYVIMSRVVMFFLCFYMDSALLLGTYLRLAKPQVLMPVRAINLILRCINLVLTVTRVKPLPNLRQGRRRGRHESGSATNELWMMTPGRWNKSNHCGTLADGAMRGVGVGDGLESLHAVKPVYVAYRIDQKVWKSDEFHTGDYLDMLRSQPFPVATRDKTCAAALLKVGVPAIFSGCASLNLTKFYGADAPAAATLGQVDAMLQTGGTGTRAATADAMIARSLHGAFDKVAGSHETSGRVRAEILAIDASDRLMARAGIPDWVRRATTHLSAEVNSKTVNGRKGKGRHVFDECVSIWEHYGVMFDMPRRLEFTARRIERLQRAKLVVTTRVHVALPCVGLGIPVILLHRELDNPKDRTDFDANARLASAMGSGDVDSLCPYGGPVEGRFDGMLDLVHCGTCPNLARVRETLHHFPWHSPPSNPRAGKLKALRAICVASAAAQVDALLVQQQQQQKS